MDPYGRFRLRRPLQREVAELVPVRGLARWTTRMQNARRNREMLAYFENPPMALLGLPAWWEGVRRIGGWGLSNKTVTRLALTHELVADTEGPELRVEISRYGPGYADEREDMEEEFFLEQEFRGIEIRGGADALDVEDLLRRRPKASWLRTTIRVDGEPLEFEAMTDGARWVALAAWGDLIVRLQGHRFPVEDVELAVVQDVEPYLEGHKRTKP